MLKIQGLSVFFPSENHSFQALNKLDLSLQSGERLAIVGESGSGKSVAMRALMGLLPRGSRVEGEIHWKGQSLLSNRASDWRRLRGRQMSMIFQEPMSALNPVQRCGKQIEEVIRLHFPDMRRQEVNNKLLGLLKEVQLHDPERILRSYPHQLSGGQRQRVMIAMALAADPELLIADEPTTALDAAVQEEVIHLLNALVRDRKMALIFITHDLPVVKKIADRCLVMFRGQKLEEAPVQELFEKPQHVYTKALLQCRPKAGERLERLPVMQDFFEMDENGEFRERAAPVFSRLVQEEYSRELLIRVRSLEVSYREEDNWGNVLRRNKVLEGIDLDIYKGETLCLLGESGSGKSTLGRAVLQLTGSEGTTVWESDSKEIATMALRERARKMQLIYQDPFASLNPYLKIGETIMEVIRVHGLHTGREKERCVTLLTAVGLNEDSLNKYPHEFSGGQRQRISIARALAAEPEFMVCDESVAALDVSVQAQVLNLLRDLQRKFQLTYLFITHDLAVARHMADRIMVLRHGGIEELQNNDELFENPQSTYTRNLISYLSE